MLQRFYIILFLAFISANLNGQSIHIDSLKIFPESPSTVDYIRIQYTVHAYSLWRKLKDEISVSGDTFTIKTCYIYSPAAQPIYEIKTWDTGKLSAGKYFVRVNLFLANEDSCTSKLLDSALDSFYISGTTGFNMPLLNNEITLYPNPSTGIQTLMLSTANSGQLDIRIYDLSGRLLKTVFSGEASQGGHKFEMDLTDLQPGVYFCKLSISGAEQTLKIIKQ